MKAVLFITDVPNRMTRHIFHAGGLKRRRTSNLTGENDSIGRRQGLASDPRVRIGGQVGIDDRIGYAIGHLVRMTFRNRFAGEEIIAGRQFRFSSMPNIRDCRRHEWPDPGVTETPAITRTAGMVLWQCWLTPSSPFTRPARPRTRFYEYGPPATRRRTIWSRSSRRDAEPADDEPCDDEPCDD